MSVRRFFCAEESRANREEMFGTVAQIRSWFLLEYAGVWRRDAVEDSRLLSSELKRHIRRLPVDRTLLIRREHQRTSPFDCYFVRSCDDAPEVVRYTLNDYDRLLDLQGPGEVVDEPIFAICTHGRHDRCCAKFGMPIWRAFRDAAGARAWQCSHVGGDRFAANVVVFPYGIYYGRVDTDDVPEMVRRSRAGEIWMRCYRGRSCFSRKVQVAEYFARAESGRLRIDEYRPVEGPRVNNGVITVVFEARSDRTLHKVEFAVRQDALVERLTCESTEESPVAQYQLRSYAARRS